MLRKCSSCFLEKPLTDFSGSYRYCRSCAADYARQKRKQTNTQRRKRYALLKKGLLPEKLAFDPNRAFKRCPACGLEKPRDQFGRASNAPDGLHGHCKPCAVQKAKEWAIANPEKRKAAYRRKYYRHRDEIRLKSKTKYWANRDEMVRSTRLVRWGITSRQFEEILEAQGKRCPICARLLADDFKNGRHARPHLEHDHTTGAVRGITCGNCNVGCAMFGDSPDICERAGRYLKNPPTRWLWGEAVPIVKRDHRIK